MDAAPGGERRLGYTVLEPLGKIGAITPFNFPMNLVAHKVGPAIATGNTIVLTGFPNTIIFFLFSRATSRSRTARWCINVITGSGRSVGNQIVTDERKYDYFQRKSRSRKRDSV
ncbi:aldehyde dehydrogenase family protein [Natribacillus halophilus]|uniref:Aldehyde dehydrogenase family protein n=1 Tax=Natribacillus halophilus TaxID=549003 RepID=A0A1G8MW16_9BACI|nr:Aldehyde dehydrogenase family protein [Natribacillus halophilus]